MILEVELLIPSFGGRLGAAEATRLNDVVLPLRIARFSHQSRWVDVKSTVRCGYHGVMAVLGGGQGAPPSVMSHRKGSKTNFQKEVMFRLSFEGQNHDLCFRKL